MKNSVLFVACLVAWSAGTVRSAEASAKGSDVPIIAVFDIDSKNCPNLDPVLASSLRDYVEGLLVQSGKYRAVPQGQIQTRLEQEKQKTGNMCYDEKCQIELGRQLAAEKSIALQVSKLGSICTVKVSLYDLRTQTTDGVRLKETSCTEDGYVAGFRQAVDDLVGGRDAAAPFVAGVVPVQASAPAPGPDPAVTKADDGDLARQTMSEEPASPAPAKPSPGPAGKEGRLKIGVDAAYAMPMQDWADINDTTLGGFGYVGFAVSPAIVLTGRVGYLYGLPKDAFGVSISTSMTMFMVGIKAFLGSSFYLCSEFGNVDSSAEASGMSTSESHWGVTGGAGLELGSLDARAQVFLPSIEGYNQIQGEDVMGLLFTLGYHFGL